MATCRKNKKQRVKQPVFDDDQDQDQDQDQDRHTNANKVAALAGVATFAGCVLCPWLIPAAIAGGAYYLTRKSFDDECIVEDEDDED